MPFLLIQVCTHAGIYIVHTAQVHGAGYISARASFVPELQKYLAVPPDGIDGRPKIILYVDSNLCILLFYPRKYDYLVSFERVLQFMLYLQSGQKSVSRSICMLQRFPIYWEEGDFLWNCSKKLLRFEGLTCISYICLMPKYDKSWTYRFLGIDQRCVRTTIT